MSRSRIVAIALALMVAGTPVTFEVAKRAVQHEVQSVEAQKKMAQAICEYVQENTGAGQLLECD